jgi:hypothetical protein
MLGAILTRSRTAAYTVHEQPAPGGSLEERSENIVFVRDGFSWAAAFLSPVYLLVRGEWRGLLVYLVAASLIAGVLQATGTDPGWIGWMLLMLNVVMGFEMSELRRWSLASRGWRQIATVNGTGQDEAERRFFEKWLPEAGPDLVPEAPLHVYAPPHATVQAHRAVLDLGQRLRAKFALKS